MEILDPITSPPERKGLAFDVDLSEQAGMILPAMERQLRLPQRTGQGHRGLRRWQFLPFAGGPVPVEVRAQ